MQRISIITITYNNYEEFINTFNSLNVIKSFNFEFIVINGGKCQKTLKFLDQNPKIISISEPDKGISDAFNKGIKKATCKYLTFLNSGDILLKEDYYIDSLKEFSNDNELYLTYTTIQKKYKTGKKLLKPTHKPIGFGIPFPHQSAIYKTSLFKEVGFFNLNYKIAMDFDHYLRMHNKGMKIIELHSLISIEMAGGGISSTQEQKALKENLRALKINGNLNFINTIFFFYRYCKYYIKKLVFRNAI